MSVGKLGLNSLPPDFFIFDCLPPCLYPHFLHCQSQVAVFGLPNALSPSHSGRYRNHHTEPFIGQIIGSLSKDNGIGSEYTILQ